jgi:FMN phosphatase YigB (HAD superfamily)
MPGAAPVLRLLLASGVVLGIASNAQPHTMRELDDRLRAVGLDAQVFCPDLSFWSFQHGFSKPDPHVFQTLNARLRARDLKPEETLMVGDRIDNDVAPARACRWMTFHLINSPPAAWGPGGLWHELAQWLEGRLR